MMVPGEAVNPTDGSELIFTLVVAVAVQPVANIVPVTVYVVLTVGAIVILDPETAPGIHTYTSAPEAVNVTESPEQIFTIGEETTLGVGFTVIFAIAVSVHPNPFVPVTVYDEDNTGANATPSVIPPVQE